MPQLLLELFSEEIPARMQAGAARDLERMAREHLAAAGFLPEALKTFAGPRRLTLVVEGLPIAQADRKEELKGPRVGAPPQAMEGFLRKAGLTQDQLVERDRVWMAFIEKTGRATPEIIAEMVEAIVRGFPWPKSMTWGSGKLRWVRPLKSILCVFDREIVPFSIDGVVSGDSSEGHRFMRAGPGWGGQAFKARDFDDYAKGLADHFVVLDVEERKARILEGCKTLCFARNLELVEDQGLLDEVAGLAEWPSPVLGDMDPAFLDLPAEVIRTSMRTHQKYFAVRDPATGGLAPHFITIANIQAADGGKVIAEGNAKVLSSRLSDARFFWDEDVKVGFEAWLAKLDGVTFHAKLGTMAQRVERIVALAGEIAPLVGADVGKAKEAARLAKADLTSEMVGEFPELQGIMGGYYARAAGMDPEIADAIRDHYRPQGPGDAVPTAPVTVAVALADKLDTLVGFFAIDEKPTGSKDPFALRRAALGVIRTILEAKKKVNIRFLAVEHAKLLLGSDYLAVSGKINALMVFLEDRLSVLLRDEGNKHDVISAAFATIDTTAFFLDDLVARVEALDGFLKTDDGKTLMAGYKRASNILKAEEKKGWKAEGPRGLLDDASAPEVALSDALRMVEPALDAALAAEDFTAAMQELAGLRGPVDAFLDGVFVNSEVPAERDNRLKTLAAVRDAMGRVADFGLVAG
ncbi:glycine--tRNA ligase subunit beta [Caulobacter sp. B11]|uniref:glycine--tRNA ligase subunit beta n=1 Tax=Caulobacter sp. B11 TaxID=2048899 RepID=UPI000C12B292|nr:glycine--tRNA ligase subunit beta [Caulobacter sp. B11]PHY14316.1 glycine--tRNA ligase subunit beta [Caulobacter sp. B11]